MSLPKEITFEEVIENTLIQDGYRQGYNENYDKGFAIDRKYLFEFLETSQPEILEKYRISKGKNWEFDLMNRLYSELEKKGIIEILRHGFEDIMIGKFQMLYAKPNSNLNSKAWEMYEKNIFSITRQLKYSENNGNSLDIVLFLNGLPIVTLELKNEYTGQNVYNAIKQYREDRDPKEQLFRFKNRVLVHFAVDTSEVFMTTELKGKSTFFLPFNKGDNKGKGNPSVENNFKTHYLWEDVLTRASLTDIIKRFYYIQTKDRKETAIFPRYHQLDVVRKVEEDILKKGTEHNYLIQHSAGSGKTNSIAWLSHRLANLHSVDNKHIFDSVLVITDRKVLDKQLQDAVYQLEHKNGVVERIDDSKTSTHLAKALELGTKIIITTIQKFPYALEKLEELSKDKKFAVIIDEAHSSTSGKNMNALKDSLAGKSLEEAKKLEENLDDRTLEDDIVELLKGRTNKGRVVFFAFTATPKHKTLEIFGIKDENNNPEPFHLYTMKQAIEEGFILDVLKNYTTYDVYYKVAKKINDNREFDSSKATREIKRYVSLHEYNIRHKVEMIVEDFIHYRMGWIKEKAKGMVVTSSRLHALKFKQEIDKYISEKGYNIKSLVAFSGTVTDKGKDYTEESVNNIKEKELPKRFSEDDSIKLLIVAEKYQTGFDEPKLCAMYVDKVLNGVAAVQTLSRLNRTKDGKDVTFILDFTNSVEEIKKSFTPYFETTMIDQPTDPNILLDMYIKLHKTGIIIDCEIEEFTKLYLKEKKSDSQVAKMNSITDKGVEKFLNIDEDKQEDFRATAIKYIRCYNFLLQIYEILNPKLYQLQVYLSGFIKKLPKVDIGDKVNLDGIIELDYFKIKQIAGKEEKGENISLGIGEDVAPLTGFTDGDASRHKEELLESLETIIEKINKIFGMNLTENDKLSIDQLENDFADREDLKQRAKSNSEADFINSFEEEFMRGMVERMSKNQDFFTKIIKDNRLKSFIVNEIAKNLYEGFTREH